MILFDAIDFIIGFLTLRWLWKKGPPAVGHEMKQAYSESVEAKKLDALARAAEAASAKAPIQAPETTRGQ